MRAIASGSHGFLLKRFVLWAMLSLALAQSVAGAHLHAWAADEAPGTTISLAFVAPDGHEDEQSGEDAGCRCPWCTPSLHFALSGRDTGQVLAAPRRVIEVPLAPASPTQTPLRALLPPKRGPPRA